MSFGKELASESEIIPRLGTRCDQLKTEFRNEMDARALPDTAVTDEQVKGLSYIVARKKLSGGTSSSVAVSLQPYGADVAVDIRYYEANPLGFWASVAAKGLRGYLAVGFIGAGILTSWIAGSGLILVLIGWLIWPKSAKTPGLSAAQSRDSDLFRQAVQLSLKNAIVTVSSLSTAG